MADTYTSSLGLVKPEIGASRDSWGSKTNANWDTLDQFVSMAAPIGLIIDFAGLSAPAGYLVCDGRVVSRVTFSALFAVIGTAFGSGDGSTTFALPNFNGRTAVGTGAMTDANGTVFSLSFAQSLGNASNLVQQAHLPNYAMATDVQGWHGHGGVTAGAGSHQHTTDAQGYHSHGGSYLPSHAHSAYSDTQGSHYHNVYEAYGYGGGGGAGAFAATGVGGFGGYTDTQGAHAHNITVNASGNLTLAITGDGYHAHTTTAIGDHAHGLYYDGNHQHTIYLGGLGNLFSIVQPILAITKLIYAGQQATTRAPTIEAAPSEWTDTTDELAMLREQIAELRALLMPARSPRLLSAPLRGPH